MSQDIQNHINPHLEGQVFHLCGNTDESSTVYVRIDPEAAIPFTGFEITGPGEANQFFCQLKKGVPGRLSEARHFGEENG
jgi:hypothetical protein